jgi:hypothetical protein
MSLETSPQKGLRVKISLPSWFFFFF